MLLSFKNLTKKYFNLHTLNKTLLISCNFSKYTVEFSIKKNIIKNRQILDEFNHNYKHFQTFVRTFTFISKIIVFENELE